ncbi:hypothetical protein EVAR_43090_1 [Eumeta japonica]|uniref:Uncharacterized protein n=1 Tax=Eumeta variegata TaxID=151549 RepID=A0A4C1WZ56_EUMVA|nr:hypothetical protein EVAR_43090_1 [Eumeta japonica]
MTDGDTIFLQIVENKSFKALIKGSQQLTKPPKVMCRITAKNKISNEYNEFKKNLKLELDNVEFVCSAVDIWSSSKRSWGLQSIGLKVRLLKGKVLQLIAEDSRGLIHMIKRMK